MGPRNARFIIRATYSIEQKDTPDVKKNAEFNEDWERLGKNRNDWAFMVNMISKTSTSSIPFISELNIFEISWDGTRESLNGCDLDSAINSMSDGPVKLIMSVNVRLSNELDKSKQKIIADHLRGLFNDNGPFIYSPMDLLVFSVGKEVFDAAGRKTTADQLFERVMAASTINDVDKLKTEVRRLLAEAHKITNKTSGRVSMIETAKTKLERVKNTCEVYANVSTDRLEAFIRTMTEDFSAIMDQLEGYPADTLAKASKTKDFDPLYTDSDQWFMDITKYMLMVNNRNSVTDKGTDTRRSLPESTFLRVVNKTKYRTVLNDLFIEWYNKIVIGINKQINTYATAFRKVRSASTPTDPRYENERKTIMRAQLERENIFKALMIRLGKESTEIKRIMNDVLLKERDTLILILEKFIPDMPTKPPQEKLEIAVGFNVDKYTAKDNLDLVLMNEWTRRRDDLFSIISLFEASLAIMYLANETLKTLVVTEIPNVKLYAIVEGVVVNQTPVAKLDNTNITQVSFSAIAANSDSDNDHDSDEEEKEEPEVVQSSNVPTGESDEFEAFFNQPPSEPPSESQSETHSETGDKPAEAETESQGDGEKEQEAGTGTGDIDEALLAEFLV